MGKLIPSCKEFTARLARGEYEEAGWMRRLGARLHLLHCELCERYEKQLRLVAEGYRAGLEKAVPDSLKKSLLDRLKDGR